LKDGEKVVGTADMEGPINFLGDTTFKGDPNSPKINVAKYTKITFLSMITKAL